VRHLAAGVLGGKDAPPAPLQPGLAQKLVWDGTDDDGKKVAGAAGMRARVRAGMGVELDRIVGGDPYAFWSEDSVSWLMCVSETIGGTGMKEPHAERSSDPLCPRVMGQALQGVWPSVDRGTSRPVIEPRNRTRSRRPTGILTLGRQHEAARHARAVTLLRGQRTWHVRTSSTWELRDPCIPQLVEPINWGGWRRC